MHQHPGRTNPRNPLELQGSAIFSQYSIDGTAKQFHTGGVTLGLELWPEIFLRPSTYVPLISATWIVGKLIIKEV